MRFERSHPRGSQRIPGLTTEVPHARDGSVSCALRKSTHSSGCRRGAPPPTDRLIANRFGRRFAPPSTLLLFSGCQCVPHRPESRDSSVLNGRESSTNKSPQPTRVFNQQESSTVKSPQPTRVFNGRESSTNKSLQPTRVLNPRTSSAHDRWKPAMGCVPCAAPTRRFTRASGASPCSLSSRHDIFEGPTPRLVRALGVLAHGIWNSRSYSGVKVHHFADSIASAVACVPRLGIPIRARG